jgi:hypothetical protein
MLKAEIVMEMNAASKWIRKTMKCRKGSRIGSSSMLS